MKKSNRRRALNSRKLQLESLEYRLCMASAGWDGFGQGSASLTYYVGDVPTSFTLDRSAVETAIEQALHAWSDVVDVTFTETSFANQRDSIEIEFTSIDGRGGTLAQAYLPDDLNRGSFAGDIEIDGSEPWELGNALGSAAFDLALVLVHELGHSLGLEHVLSFGSVMYPSVSPNQSFTALSADDVDAALALYAPAEAAPGTDTADPPADPTPTDAQPDTPMNDAPDPRTRRNPWGRSGDGGRFGGGRGRFGRIVAGVHVETLSELNLRYHNSARTADVNGDSTVSALDALLIINQLNTKGPHQLDPAEGEGSSQVAMVDVNGDNQISAIDALQVINELNSQSAQVTDGSGTTATQETDESLIDESPADDSIAEETIDDELTNADPVEDTTEGDPVDEQPSGDDSSAEDSEDQSNDEEESDNETPVNDGPIGEEHESHCPRGRSLFDRLDANEDGVLTEDEVPDVLWDRLITADADTDGAVTSEELANADFIHLGQHRHDHPGRHGHQLGHHSGERLDLFSRFDNDEDGLLTQDEVPERLWDRIANADLDSDDAVSLQELRNYRSTRRTNV